MRWLSLMLAAGFLLGCANSPGWIQNQGRSNDIVEVVRGSAEEAELHKDLVRQLIEQEQYYAALAHMDAYEQKSGADNELRALRADVLRRLNRYSEATALYKQLFDTPYRGYAYHGLGLMYAQTDLQRGTEYLEHAVRQVPTDARMRNDLGYALMLQGELEQARLHLATAYQLDQRRGRSRNNYIVYLLFAEQEDKARRIAAEGEVDDALFDELHLQAAELRRQAANRQTRVDSEETDEPERNEVADGQQAASQSDDVAAFKRR